MNAKVLRIYYREMVMCWELRGLRIGDYKEKAYRHKNREKKSGVQFSQRPRP